MTTNIAFIPSRPQAYAIVEDGELLGHVSKTFRHGYTYWKLPGVKALFSTRDEAARSLIGQLKAAARIISEAAESGVDYRCLRLVKAEGWEVVVEVDLGGPSHEGMHPSDCERVEQRYTVNLAQRRVL